MATELGVAYISLLPEMRGFRPAAEKGMDRVGKGVATRFGVGFNGAIGSIVSRSAGIFAAGFASVKVGGFLKDAITQASDLGETTSKVTQIFGPAAKDILKFSKTSATALGQTQQAALDANATFGIFGKAAGLQGKQLSGFTTELTTLASDLASFNNTSPEQAIEAIGAALRGESEPMRAYGVLLDDASLRQEALRQGLVKTTKDALTPQQKVLAAQALILKQTTTAQGDFARTSGGLANQQRILSARFNDFKTTIGAVALPLATKLFGFLNEKGIPALQGISTRIREFVSSRGFQDFLADAQAKAMGLFGFLREEALPRLKDFGGFIKDTVVPALGSMAGFVKSNSDFFKPFAIAIVGIVAALKAWAIAQGILNAVMALNPIGLVVIALAALVAGLIWAYKNSETFRNIVDGAFKVVQAAGKLMWEGVLKPLFADLVAALKVTWQRAQDFGKFVAAGFDAIKEPARAALAWVVERMLDFVGSMIDAAAKAFGWVPGIGDNLKTAAGEFRTFRDSVNNALDGVKDQSLNFEIKYSSTGVNLTTPSSVGRRAIGGPGGPVRGPGTTTSDTAGLYALSNKEWVIRAKATEKYGDHAMAAVNAGRATIIPNGGFATGGSPGFGIRSSFPSSSTIESDAEKYARAFSLAVGKKVAASGGGRLGGALAFARSQVGKPYIWGGTGPAGYDCSGFLSALVNVAQGRSPYSRRFATGSMPGGVFQKGPGAFSVSWFRGNPGHTAGTLLGQNVESRGGVGPIVGPAARGASSSLFNSGIYHLPGFNRGGKVGDGPFDLLNPRGKYYLGDAFREQINPKVLSFDSGGLMPTGYGIYHNGTGKPEPVGHDLTRPNVRVYIGNEEITRHIRVVAEDVVNESSEFNNTRGRMR